MKSPQITDHRNMCIDNLGYFEYRDNWNIYYLGKMVILNLYYKTIRNGTEDHQVNIDIDYPSKLSFSPTTLLGTVIYHESHDGGSVALELTDRYNKFLHVYLQKYAGCHIYICVIGFLK